MKSKRILIDIDGVLADYNGGIAKIIIDRYGIEVPISGKDITDWYQYRNTIGRNLWKDVWKFVNDNPSFMCNLNPLASPYEFSRIESLNLNNDLYFVTNRASIGIKIITEKWLMKHNISYPTVILSKHKGLIAAGLEADFIIEDSPKNIISIYRDSPKTKIYLMSYPYNKEVEYLATKCVNSIGEFLDDINKVKS